MGHDVTPAQVVAHRVRVQQLDVTDNDVAGAAVLDLGVQDTGTGGALWALAARGAEPPDPGDLALAWTLRGAPHLYRRADLAQVARAVRPLSEADAAKRVFDASRPLKAAGIPVLTALERVAAEMADIVTGPMVKGEVSTELTTRLPEPYLRWCRPCQATHLYEQPFRLSALQAGLELEPGTSPPVLRPVSGLRQGTGGPDGEVVDPRLQVVRGALHLLGPSTPTLVAGFLDAAVAAVRAAWPGDVAEVTVDGQRRWALEGDLGSLVRPADVRGVRLLGSHDLLLQARDRDLLVPDPDRAKSLWPVLGRPGALLVDGRLAGLWRPRARGRGLDLRLELWAALSARSRRELEVQAGRLADHRGLSLTGLETAGG